MLMMWEMGICCFSVIVGLSMAQCISAEPWVVYLLWAVVILTFFHLFCSSSVVSWKVLPGILQKHCCILPDRNAGKDLTDVPLSTNDTTHTQCWDRRREPVCESNEQAVIPGNGDSVGGSYLSACSTSRSWPCFSHSVDLPCPDLTVWPQTAHFILLTLNYSFPTSLLPLATLTCVRSDGVLCVD